MERGLSKLSCLVVFGASVTSVSPMAGGGPTVAASSLDPRCHLARPLPSKASLDGRAERV